MNAGGDDSFIGGAVGFGTGLGDAALTQQLDGGVHIAIGFGEDFLAVHHAGVGFFAEFLDGGG